MEVDFFIYFEINLPSIPLNGSAARRFSEFVTFLGSQVASEECEELYSL